MVAPCSEWIVCSPVRGRSMAGRSTQSLGMNKITAALAIGLLTCGTGALAADSVTIELMPGSPLPGASAEKVTLEILRIPAGFGPNERPIDQYFEAVRAALKSCGVTENWQYLSPDSAFARARIALDGRNIVLMTDRFALRPEAARDMPVSICDSANQNKNDRYGAALNRILELSMERSRSKFGK